MNNRQTWLFSSLTPSQAPIIRAVHSFRLFMARWWCFQSCRVWHHFYQCQSNHLDWFDRFGLLMGIAGHPDHKPTHWGAANCKNDPKDVPLTNEILHQLQTWAWIWFTVATGCSQDRANQKDVDLKVSCGFISFTIMEAPRRRYRRAVYHEVARQFKRELAW